MSVRRENAMRYHNLVFCLGSLQVQRRRAKAKRGRLQSGLQKQVKQERIIRAMNSLLACSNMVIRLNIIFRKQLRWMIIQHINKLEKIDYLIKIMESQGSQVVIIYLPTFGDQDQLREALANQINSGVSQHAIVIKNKGHGITAYVELPQKKAQQLCAKKNITVLSMTGKVKRFFSTHQIFINKLHQKIDADDVKEYFSQFGTVLDIQIVHTTHSYYSEKPVDMRHCYIQLKEKDSASKIINHHKRHFIKNQEIKIHKTYDIGEGENTDKKLYVKIQPKCDQPENVQYQLQILFSKYGQLRERVRLEQSKASFHGTLTFTTIQAGEKAYNQAQQTMIDGKYKVTLKPHTSDLSIFAKGLKKGTNEADIRKAFGIFGKLFDVKLLQNNFATNAKIYYASQDDAKRALAQYIDHKEITSLYAHRPYLNVTLNLRQKREYENFERRNDRMNEVGPKFQQPPMNPMMGGPRLMMPQQMMNNNMPRMVPGGQSMPAQEKA